MSKLFALVYGIAATVLAGIFIIVVLVAEYSSSSAIILAAIAGAVVAIPIAQSVAKKLEN